MTCTISFLENTVFWFVLFAFETGTYCVSIAILELPNITTGLELTLLHLPLPTECCYKSSASIGNTSLKVGYTLCSTSVSSQGWSVPMIWMWTLIRYIYVQQGKTPLSNLHEFMTYPNHQCNACWSVQYTQWSSWAPPWLWWECLEKVMR